MSNSLFGLKIIQNFNNHCMSKKIVIFDLLGVITKESMFATNIIYPIVKDKISYDLFKKKYLLYAIGNISREDFWEYICQKKEINNFEKKIIQKTVLTPGIKKVINDLIASRCRLYLATEIPRYWGEMILKKAGVQNVFKMKFYSSDLFTTKPFYNFYKKVFGEIRDGDIYYIDDTLINLIAAKKIKKHNTIYYSQSANLNNVKGVDNKINTIKEIKNICKIKK